jgi:lipopolysaccharide/colanic/teichoic acid biosynthesis glycosyltransferase
MLNKKTYLLIKRFFDVVFSLIGLTVSIPVISILIAVFFITGQRSFFFKQTRVGWKEKLFKLYKLKTMNDKKDSSGALLSDEKRITKFGKIVRWSSLDELPQLLNVLKGEMSFVGPRPLLKEYLPLYTTEQKKRHALKPGITGLAQIYGRNAISWEKKFQLDISYTKKYSFFLDIKILFITVMRFFRPVNINQPNISTVEPFNGTN